MTRGRSVRGTEMTEAEVTGAEVTGAEMVWGRMVEGPRWFWAEVSVNPCRLSWSCDLDEIYKLPFRLCYKAVLEI